MDRVRVETNANRQQLAQGPLDARSDAPPRDDVGAICGAVDTSHDAPSPVEGRHAADVEEAFVDPLTGIDGRRMIERDLVRLGAEQERYDRRFAVLFANIDRFKAVNDQYGREVGDEVLKVVARKLRSCIRPGDSVGRWGGDEFLVFAPIERPVDAHRMAQRIRREAGSCSVDVEGQEVWVSLSVGVAISSPSEPTEDTVVRADAAMLTAKRQGRNRTVVDQSLG